MSKNSYNDLKDLLDLKEGELEELYNELSQKEKKINSLSNYIHKLKYENKANELKLDMKGVNEKSRLKELDNLEEKIKGKEEIIEDKHDQVIYLREIINDNKTRNSEITENLEVQLRKISKSYENLLNQKDLIIEKQDEIIKRLTKTIEEINKTNKTNVISLELQNKKYKEIIDKFMKK